jgi:predicted small secreted protein
MMPWRFTSLLFAGLLAFGAAGCNTFEGLGQDIEQGGEAVTDAAEEVEDEIDD